MDEAPPLKPLLDAHKISLDFRIEMTLDSMLIPQNGDNIENTLGCFNHALIVYGSNGYDVSEYMDKYRKLNIEYQDNYLVLNRRRH